MSAEKTRPHDRKDDAAVGGEGGGAVDLRGLDDFAVDAAQAREKHRHDEAGGLPDAGDRDAINHHPRIDDPVEFKARPPPIVDRLLKPDAGIEKELPCRACHDEGESERVEIDGPQDSFAADFLVEQNGERQAEEQTEHDIESAKMPMLTMAVYQFEGGSVSNVQFQSLW